MLVQDQFEIENGRLIAYLGPGPDVQVPEGVHTIGEGVFKGMSWLLSVKLPETVRKIEAMAFKGCRKLTTINFPDGLTEIGEYAFHRCHGIRELIFPASMTKLGACAFLYCDSLEKVVIEGPLHLPKASFSHDIMLNEIALNENVDASNFSDEVFEGCVHIKKIILSGKVYETDSLIEVLDSDSSYPPLVKSLARGVYHAMQIENGVLNTFSVNLKSIFLPEGITAIGKGCFFDKKGIVKITLPDSVKEIRANAFLNCQSLEEIVIPNPDILLDDRAFRGCCNLKKVVLSGETYLLTDETKEELVSRIRDQVMGDFYISGRILVRYMGNEEQISIPKEVKIIGERCFFGNERLKTVLCPDGLLEIREEAFSGCVALQNIVLPPGLRRVEREAFAECKKLLKCNIPASIEYIGEYAFRRCFMLKSFENRPENAEIHPYAFYRADNFPQPDEKNRKADNAIKYDINEHDKKSLKNLKLTGTEKIGNYEYAFCPELEEIYIDAPECMIGQNAFSNCPKLKKAVLKVKELGKAAFSYCRNLSELSLSSVSVLPTECFAGCYSLKKFDANEITRMDARCFDECIGLDSFDFSGIRIIGDRAFERCVSLERAELDRVECGYHAFADCSGLKSVKFTDNTVFKSNVFTGCTQIKSFTYDSVKYEFSKFSDSLNHTANPYPEPVREVISSVYSCFEITERTVLTAYHNDAEKVTIPEDITEIGQDVFREHMRLEEINIPESVRLFGSHAFSMTKWLAVQKEKSETVIVNNVLLDGAMCKGRVIIPDFVKRIASWCFAGNTGITELVIPSERIIVESLSFRNCLNLKKITDWNGQEYVLTKVSDLTEGKYPELVQRIFEEVVNCFKLDDYGNLVESTGNIIDLTFPEGIKSICDSVYKDCHLLESIALSSDTERIGKSAFENSKWLRLVTNAGSVKSIGPLAFSGCQSLEEIGLSDSLEEIGIRCFEHCAALKEIYISKQLETIPERAFFRCKSLKKLTIPESVKVIEKEAFAFCTELSEVYVSEKTQISDSAFAFCDKIQIFKY